MDSQVIKQFRINAKYLFLTYSQVPNHWTLEFVKQQLIRGILINTRGLQKYESKVKAYVISEELHQEKIGNGDYIRGKHYHCFIELNKIIDIKTREFLDIEGYNGNYQAVRSIKATIDYVKKHGNYIEEGFPGMKLEDRKILDATQSEAELMLFPKMKPMDKLRMKEKIDHRKNQIQNQNNSINYNSGTVINYFADVIYPVHPGAGINKYGRPKAVFFYGPPETGKTTTAHTIAVHANMRLIRVIDAKQLASTYDGEQLFLFDELKIEDLFDNQGKVTDLYSLIVELTTLPGMTTKVHFYAKNLAWPRKLVMCSNNNPLLWPLPISFKSRVIFCKTNANKTYQYQIFEEKQYEGKVIYKLKNLTEEEARKLIHEPEDK